MIIIISITITITIMLSLSLCLSPVYTTLKGSILALWPAKNYKNRWCVLYEGNETYLYIFKFVLFASVLGSYFVYD